MITLAVIMLAVVLLFLYLGGLLQLYAPTVGVSARGDRLFPEVALGHLPAAIQLVFLVALISALFPSADGALTALTSSFCIDILGISKRQELSETERTRIRQHVHLAFAAVFLAIVLAFKAVNSPSMIGVILTIAAYTYGPLLGLFAFAIFTRRRLSDPWVPAVALAAPLICYGIDHHQQALFGSYQVGLELLVVNGVLTFAGLWLISRRATQSISESRIGRATSRRASG
jgi:Na+/proline symporter